MIDDAEKVPTAILISGRGSNMQAIVEATQADDYPVRVCAVISNRPDAAGITWAQDKGLDTSVVDHTAFDSREAFEEELHKVLLASGAQLVALAGFLRIMTEGFVRRWEGRMINIHPSLLPSFKGLHTHEKALEAGVKIAGCTVHYVSPDLDSGAIIAQAAVPVLHDDTTDTLAARILVCEHKIYPAALGLVARGGAPVVDGKVALDVDNPEAVHLLSLAPN